MRDLLSRVLATVTVTVAVLPSACVIARVTFWPGARPP